MAGNHDRLAQLAQLLEQVADLDLCRGPVRLPARRESAPWGRARALGPGRAAVSCRGRGS